MLKGNMLVAIALLALTGIQASDEAEAKSTSRVFWTVPYGFADATEDYPDPNDVYQQIEGTRSNLDLNQGPAWGYQFKGLKWTGWGTRRAVGSGDEQVLLVIGIPTMGKNEDRSHRPRGHRKLQMLRQV